MTPSTRNTEGQKCVCELGSFDDNPLCGQPYMDNTGAGRWCQNVVEGNSCAHDRACHTPSAPADPMVSISLSDAKVLQQYLATSIFIDNEESAFFRFESAIASTQSPEGK